jgi:hypothetical protein
MAYKLVKKLPENYSDEIIGVFEALTLQHGDKPFLIGSGTYKVDFPSDYDLTQEVPVNKFILKDMQDVVRRLLKLKNVFIGDIKSGSIPELKVVDKDLTIQNYKHKRAAMIEKLKTMYADKTITKEEMDDSIVLLKPKLTMMDIYIIKHEIEFDTIRWKPRDILNGFVTYRGYKVDFYKYLFDENATKIDVIVWLNGVRYNEISNLYIFMKHGKPLNVQRNTSEQFIKLLIDQMPFLLYEGKYLKICKRINSIERAKRDGNQELLQNLYKLFNSNIGRLGQVLSDISVLEFMIENITELPKAKFEYEIDQMKYRLGNMTNRRYIAEQPKFIKLLAIVEKDVLDIDKLDKLRTEIFDLLESETLKFMKEYGLYPIPKEYLPVGIEGKGVADTIVKGLNYVSNLFPASDKEATEIEAGEKHGVLILPNGKIGRANYMGPGTNLIKRLKRGDKPRTEMDELSRAHDIRYDLAKSQADIEEADRIFIKAAKKIRKEKKDYSLNTYVGQVPIQAKYYAEKHGLIKPMFKQSPEQTKEDEALMRATLKDAIAKGYGANRTISLKKKDLLREHTKLIDILTKGTKQQQLKEAADQQKEMAAYA